MSKVGFPKWVTNFVTCSLNAVSVSPFLGSPSNIWIPITRGVKQGCPLSPLLFLISYDPLLTALSKLPHLTHFAFADDLAITSTSLSAIPALSTIDDFSQSSGLGIKCCLLSTGTKKTYPKIRNFLSRCPWPDLTLLLNIQIWVFRLVATPH